MTTTTKQLSKSSILPVATDHHLSTAANDCSICAGCILAGVCDAEPSDLPWTSSACRPLAILESTSRLAKRTWREADQMRISLLNSKDKPDWMDWCHLPHTYWRDLTEEIHSELDLTPLGVTLLSTKLATLNSWRLAKQIIKYDKTVFDEVRESKIDGYLPANELSQFPVHCFYVETNGLSWQGKQLHGFYVRWNQYSECEHPHIEFMLDTDRGFAFIPIAIGNWSITDAVRDYVPAELLDVVVKSLEPLVSLVLYICTQANQITTADQTTRPIMVSGIPYPTNTKHGPKYFPADKPRVWNVGLRLGAALRQAHKSVASTYSASGHGSAMRPHVRRGHWHTVLIGPRINKDGSIIPANQRDSKVFWQPPISINFDDPDDNPATIRPVKRAA